MVVEQYFNGASSLYNETSFERQFGCPWLVVERVWKAIHGCKPFILKTNRATLQPGIWPLVRFTTTMRMIIYGDCADRNDELLQV